MRTTLLLTASLLALSGCSSAVSLGDPTPGAPSNTEGTDPVLVVPTPTTIVAYPEGPYGKTAGSVLPQMSWDGYREGGGEWTKVDMLDYYDPKGEKGYKALLVEMSALWCGVCRGEAGRFMSSYSSMKDKGIRVISLIIEGNSHAASTQADVDSWIKQYKCQYDVVQGKIMDLAAGGGSIGLPYNVIVDPRDMKVYKVVQGDGASVDAALDAVVKKNST